MILTKVNIIGEQAWHVFVDGKGNLIEEECTVADYDKLALPNPINPTKEGCTWKFSRKDFKYDTLSGRLENGCYAEHNGRLMVKIVNNDQKNLPLTSVVNDELKEDPTKWPKPL